MSFPATQSGRYGFEKQTTSAKKQVYGATMTLPDGRVYRYVENGGTAIGEGLVVASEAPAGNHDEDLVVSTSASVGDLLSALPSAVLKQRRTFMQRGICFPTWLLQPRMRCTRLSLIP